MCSETSQIPPAILNKESKFLSSCPTLVEYNSLRLHLCCSAAGQPGQAVEHSTNIHVVFRLLHLLPNDTGSIYIYTYTHMFYLLGVVSSYFSEEELNTWSIRKQVFLFSWWQPPKPANRVSCLSRNLHLVRENRSTRINETILITLGQFHLTQTAHILLHSWAQMAASGRTPTMKRNIPLHTNRFAKT